MFLGRVRYDPGALLDRGHKAEGEKVRLAHRELTNMTLLVFHCEASDSGAFWSHGPKGKTQRSEQSCKMGQRCISTYSASPNPATSTLHGGSCGVQGPPRAGPAQASREDTSSAHAHSPPEPDSGIHAALHLGPQSPGDFTFCLQ